MAKARPNLPRQDFVWKTPPSEFLQQMQERGVSSMLHVEFPFWDGTIAWNISDVFGEDNTVYVDCRFLMVWGKVIPIDGGFINDIQPPLFTEVGMSDLTLISDLPKVTKS